MALVIPKSTVAGVRSALTAGITTQIGDTTVGVFNGPPPAQNTKNDLIVIMGARRQTVSGGQRGDFGAGRLQEIYHVEVVSRCFRGGNNFATADTRAWALNDAVEAYVRNDPTIGGNLNIQAYPESSDAVVEWEANNKGVIVQVTTLIYCHAQI